MLNKSLKNKKDFDNVFKNGKGFSQGFLYLKIKKNNLNSSRFGFVVSNKFSKKAVIRNKIKRRLKEIIKSKNIRKNIDAVIIVNPGAETGFKELEQTITKLFKKAGIIWAG